MGFSRAIDPAIDPALLVPFVLYAEPLRLTAKPLPTLADARVTKAPITTSPASCDASSQTMVNQSLTAEAAPALSRALSPPLVNAAGERAEAASARISPPTDDGHDQTDDPQDYAINHWRRHESDAEHAFRVMRAEQEAQSLFARATVKQKEGYDAAMADLRVFGGLRAPRYQRIRAAALRVWRDSTQDARVLYFRTCDVLMRSGEIPDELDRAWTRLIDPARAERLWGNEE